MDDDIFETVPVVRIDSPCINICEIDDVTGLCAGCSRTIDEISRWSSGTATWRDAVIRELPGRRRLRDLSASAASL